MGGEQLQIRGIIRVIRVYAFLFVCLLTFLLFPALPYRHRGARIASFHKPRNASATRAMTSPHFPGAGCRNNRAVGYQGLSSRPDSQRQL